MSRPCPRLVIAGTGSGVGKTSLALGLARLLARRGLRVQTFKVGPDFLDPTYLASASGRTCYNLDGWMTSRDYVRELFARATADADVALVEGVMGLFDGSSPQTREGSTAEIAAWLDAPVVLVAGVHGVARSLAACVQGFARFDPEVRVAAVIANRGGSQRHRDWLRDSLAHAGCPPLVGMLPRDALAPLPSRHLGLVSADWSGLDAGQWDQLADACQQHVDVDQLLSIAACNGNSPLPPGEGQGVRAACRNGMRVAEPVVVRPHPSPLPEGEGTEQVRLGIARDAAFHFYYPDNLDALRAHGAELIFFSPLADRQLPPNLDGLYFGGGYPELFAEQLAENRALLADVRQFSADGRCLYAECGGLMYLGRSLTTLEGARFDLAGVLPIDTAMLPKLQTLGYAEVTWSAPTPWGPAGHMGRGHEFHYSQITADHSADQGWHPACTLRRLRAEPAAAGFVRGRSLASYVHLHWASRPEMVRHFLDTCG